MRQDIRRAGASQGIGRCIDVAVSMMALAVTAIPAFAAEESAEPFVVNRFDPGFQFAYSIGSWVNQVSVAEGRVILKGLKCDGGAGFLARLDLSAFADRSPVLRIKTTDRNTAKSVQIKLVDAQERTGSWRLRPLPQAEPAVASRARAPRRDRCRAAVESEHATILTADRLG
jgi:hypothetical protein